MLTNKIFIQICSKYSDYPNVFSLNFTIKVPQYTDINNHAIKLKEDEKTFYDSIYNQDLVKLKNFKDLHSDLLKI